MGCTLAVIVFAIFALLTCRPRPIEEVLATPHPTDEEFLRQLGPEVSPDTALKVRRAIVDVSGWDTDEIWPDTRLAEFCD